MIAGQGTIGLEILKQAPNLDALFISVGGGGLLSGIASYIKTASPHTKIIACWPQNAPALYTCLQQGCITEVSELPTISDGTAGGVELGSITFDLCQQLIDDCILVSEDEIIYAMKLIAEHEQWIIEGSAGVAVAGLLKMASHYKGQKVGVVLCGRNIQLDKFAQVIN